MISQTVCSLSLLCLISISFAGTTADDEQLVLTAEVIKATRVVASIEKEIVERIASRMVELRATEKYGDLPDDFFTETEDETVRIIRLTFSDEEVITSYFAPIYMKHFDVNELKRLIEFYRSPLGQKVLSLKPVLEGKFGKASDSLEREVIIPQVIDIVQAKLEEYASPSASQEL